ncbi:MAG: WD40-repeat-containing domain protein [Benniella sp.]|nr:MAG: WD40-repeat-containing domain protein [Benniella sp.]
MPASESYCIEDVNVYAYSPRGDQLAFSNSDVAVAIWNILTGDCENILHGHSDNVTGIAYSPQGDRIASASEDTTVKLWDVESGDCLNTLSGHGSIVKCIAYSPNGNQIASGSSDCTVRLWNVKTGECSHILVEEHGYVWTVAYSPRGDHVASINGSDQDRLMIRLWNVATGDCHFTIPAEYRNGHFTYSPRGDQVACTKSHDILLWEVETGNLLHTLAGHREKVLEIVYSPQGNLVASYASNDTTVRLWDAETGVCLRILACHWDPIRSVAFSPNGDRIISGSNDAIVRIWDIRVRISQRTSSSHNNRDVIMVECSPKGDQVASCSKDMTVRLWDVATGACRYILRGHSDAVRCIAYSPQETQIASGSDDTTVRLWDVETGGCTHTLTGHSDVVTGIVYSSGRRDQLASYSHDNTVRLWNMRSGECLRTWRGDFPGVRYLAVLSPNGSQIATRIEDMVRLRDVETDAYTDELCEGVDGHSMIIWSPQGDQMAIFGSGRPMMLWNIENNENQAGNESDHGSVLYTDVKCERAAFSPNGLQIAVVRECRFGEEVHLYDTTTGRQLWASEGRQDGITSITYSPHGDLIGTGSFDETVRLWDAVSGQCRAFIHDFQHSVLDIAWVETANAKYVVVGCENGIVEMWQVLVDESRCQVRLHWKSTTGEFDVEGATIQDVKGLNSLNKRILKQSGAKGEPDHRLREGSKEEATVAPMVSTFKDTSEGAEEAFINHINIPAKRLLELDEEDEGVAKRTRGNESVSGWGWDW